MIDNVLAFGQILRKAWYHAAVTQMTWLRFSADTGAKEWWAVGQSGALWNLEPGE